MRGPRQWTAPATGECAMRQLFGGATRWAVGLALFVAGLLPAMAVSQGITLTRTPAPPQAVLQTGVQSIAYAVTYGSIADSFRLSIANPSGVTLLDDRTPIGGQPSPLAGVQPFVPGSAAPLGRYRAQLDFFAFPNQLETSAFVTFDVADALGTLTILKFEDLNGNGTREPDEPGVPGWRFSLVNPQGNGSVVATGPDGTLTLPSVPAGTWTVTEVMEPGWLPITPVTGPLTVPANGVGAYAAANARPADICGTVFVDADRDGVLDPGEVGHAGGSLTLEGADLPATVTSNSDGAYCFEQLPPGEYGVTLSLPSGFTNTTALSIPGIGLRSGVTSNNNDFGIAAPPGTTQGGPNPRPDVRIGKNGPRAARRGQVFDYRLLVRNRSDFTARGVEVTDLVPIDLTLVGIPRGATIRNGVVTWSVGNLPPGRARAMSMRVRVVPRARGVIANVGTVTARGLPPRRAVARTRIVGRQPAQRTGGVTG